MDMTKEYLQQIEEDVKKAKTPFITSTIKNYNNSEYRSHAIKQFANLSVEELKQLYSECNAYLTSGAKLLFFTRDSFSIL